MILELSGHLNYNYHCGNVLWLWSVLLEDQDKISSKPGVLAFTSTLLSLKIPREKQQQQQPEGAIPAPYFTHTTSRPRGVYAGSWPHLHPLKGLSLSDNLFISTIQSPRIPWSLQDGASASQFTPLHLWLFLAKLQHDGVSLFQDHVSFWPW